MTQPVLPPPEFSRPVDVRQIEGRTMMLEANEAERAALARRFALVRIDRLQAELLLSREGDAVNASGTLTANIVQSCAVSAEDLPVSMDEPVAMRFVPERAANAPDEEIELDAGELDEIPYSGATIDLGEAVAQSLGLAIDPFATGPGAEEARRIAGMLDEQSSGPFAALAALKKKD
jgi:uncharacterized metal-binding protein YceD (DUF177 family)